MKLAWSQFTLVNRGWPQEVMEMTKLEKIESEITVLSRSELSALREWFREYDAEEWDRQLEADADSGKLDQLAEKALANRHRHL